MNDRLFIGCRIMPRLKVMDALTGENIAVLPCVKDADDVFYDYADSLVFISGGEGFIDIFKEIQKNNFVLINHIPTANGARTSLWLPGEKELLLAVPEQDGEQAALWVYNLTLN